MLGIGFSILNSNSVTTPAVVTTMNTGANLVSMESVAYTSYDPAVGPSSSDYPFYTTTLLNWLQSEGVKSIRFTISWEAIQSSLNGTIPCTTATNYITYWTHFINTVTALLSRGIHVNVCIWQANSSGSSDVCYQGGYFSSTNFANLWGPLASAINSATSNDQRVGFDLINEPYLGATVAGSHYSDFTPYAQAAINAIRATGATNRIYYEGYNYTSAGTFVSESGAEFLKLTDSAKNLAVSVHNYYGEGVGVTYGNNPSNSSNTSALTDAMTSLVAWSRANGNIIINIGEMAVDMGQPNGNATNATNQWSAWQTYCLANKDIIDGWNWWAVSEYNWWSTDDSTQGANWGLNTGSDTTPSIYMNLIQSTLGSF